MFNHTDRHIRTLKRRYDHVKKRADIANFDASWDKAELTALHEAIHWLELLDAYPWMKKELEEAGRSLVNG